MEILKYFNEHQVQLAIICSLVSFGVTQVVKPFWKKADGIDKEQGVALTRLCAIITGGIVGYTLTYAIVDLWLGAGIGAINTIVAAKVRKRLGIEQPQADDSAKDVDSPQS